MFEMLHGRPPDPEWHVTPYRWYFERTSDIARQLAFAGLGAAWLISVELTRKTGVPPEQLNAHARLLPEIVPATLFFVIALAADLVQYIVATIAAWRARKRSVEPPLDPPHEAVFFLVLKVLAVAEGDFWLISSVAHRLTS